jgi:hypothetical protein
MEDATTELLKSCVACKPPLGDRSVHALKGFVGSFADLATKSRSPAGQQELQACIGLGDAIRMTRFFTEDVVVDD